MQLFLSWSGDRSKALASLFRDWVPLLLQPVTPWFSPDDIDKGSRWLAELSKQLDRQGFGFVFVTPENMLSPWLLFETGALSKSIEASSVCPILLDLEPNQVQGPLAQFQATRVSFEDIRRLLSMVNKRQESPLSDSRFDTLFKLLWPSLETGIGNLPAPSIEKLQRVQRDVPEIVGEVLERVRALERMLGEVGRATQPEVRPIVSSDERFAIAEVNRHQNAIEQRLTYLKSRLLEFANVTRVIIEAMPIAEPRLLAAKLAAEDLLKEAEDETARVQAYIYHMSAENRSNDTEA